MYRGLPWRKCANGVDAAYQAKMGHFVVGGLSSTITGGNHGHVVIVVDGPIAQSKYPTAWWGKWGSEGEKNTVNYSFSRSVRDLVQYYYFILPPNVTPGGETLEMII